MKGVCFCIVKNIIKHFQSSSMAFVSVAGMEFRILNKIGGGGFSRVYELLGPDNVIRAVKMVNTLGMDGEVNQEELRLE